MKDVNDVQEEIKSGARPNMGRHVYAVVVAFLAIAVYINCLGNGFVFDDMVQVVRNQWMTDTRYLGDIFSSGVWGFAGLPSNYYRPMMHIIYMAVWHIFGPAPWNFHVVSVALHAAVSVVLYYLLAALVARRGLPAKTARVAAFSGALLFAVHPIHTEAVCWAAGVPDLSYALFYLISVYAYIVSMESTANSRSYRAVSVAAFLLAGLSKEPALTLPGVLVACDYACGVFKRFSVKDTLVRYAPYILVMAVYMVLRLNALGSFAPNKSHSELNWLQLIKGAVVLLGGYMRMLVLPYGLSGFHGYKLAIGVFSTGFIAAVAFVCVFAALSLYGIRKERILLLAVALTILPLLPALYIPVVGKSPLAERYLYLPSAGLSLAVAFLVARSISVGRLTGRAALSVVLITSSLFAVATGYRNQVWKDNLSYWTDAVRKAPSESYPLNALGMALNKAGRHDEAAAMFTRSIELDPSYDEPYVNLGNYYNSKNELDKAAAYYNKALAINRKNSNALNNLGVVYARQGKLVEAASLFQAAVRANKYYIDAYDNLVHAYSKLGMPEKANAAAAAKKAIMTYAPVSIKTKMVVGGKGTGR
jgi:protein O-mannosyl-transferase